MNDVILYSKKIATPHQLVGGYIIIQEGKIIDVCQQVPELSLPLVDASDLVVMPGVIDPHVHINEPGHAEWEGFNTATAAALRGGVTTVVDMPLNSLPVTTTVAAFEEKLQSANGKIHCHCGFWGGIIPGNENEIQPLAQRGVLGFKAFLAPSGLDEFPNVTSDDLRRAMPLIAATGLPLLVHCELLTDPVQMIDVKSYDQYLRSRPAKWEDDAIALMIGLCEEFKCRVHIVHLSSSTSLEQIERAKDKGLPLTVETAQHYLFFNAEEIENGRTEFKCAPPIRDKNNNDRLWKALKDGLIDFVATDHSPSTPEMKHLETGNFDTAWGGIASLQFALPALWTAARLRGYSVDDIPKWLCEKPSQLIGKSNRKGKIEKGYDADIILWDPEKTFRVQTTAIQHKHKVTPYAQKELYGVVDKVFLKGKLVEVQNGLKQKNYGEFIFNRDNNDF